MEKTILTLDTETLDAIIESFENGLVYTSLSDNLVSELMRSVEMILRELNYVKYRIPKQLDHELKGKRCYRITRREKKEFWIGMYDEKGYYDYIRFEANGYINNDKYTTHIKESDCLEIICRMLSESLNGLYDTNVLLDKMIVYLGKSWTKKKHLDVVYEEMKTKYDTVKFIEELKGSQT